MLLNDSDVDNSKVYFEPASMFAWTIVVIILSIILEKTMLMILRKEKDND